jgi:transposase
VSRRGSVVDANIPSSGPVFSANQQGSVFAVQVSKDLLNHPRIFDAGNHPDVATAALADLERESIDSISMDMWPAFINATLECVPEAEYKIAFDQFHVAKYLGDAVRRQEHKMLMAQGDETLKGSKHDGLYNLKNMALKRKRQFKALRESTLRTARAWAIKQLAMSLWHCTSKVWARKRWEQWLSWAMRCRLAPMKRVAQTITSRINMLKVRSRGFRNKQRFANAIYFYLGGLDLYPATALRAGSPT